MTRKYISLLLAIGMMLCFLTACPAGPKPPDLPMYDAYVPLFCAGGIKVPEGVVKEIGYQDFFYVEDVNDDLPSTRKFWFNGVKYKTTINWGTYEEHKNALPGSCGADVYYETEDGKLRFVVYHDAQVRTIMNCERVVDTPLPRSEKDFVNRATALFDTMVEDASLYECRPGAWEFYPHRYTVEFIKYIDGYPTADKATFYFDKDTGVFQHVECPYLNKIKDRENVEYDLARGEELVIAGIDRIVENNEDNISECSPYTVQFEQFAVLKNGQLALQYHAVHSFVIGSMTYKAGYTIYVPI